MDSGLLIFEALWTVALLVLLAAAMVHQTLRQRRKAAEAGVAPAVSEALSVYLGGNHDLIRLRDLAKKHRPQVEEFLLAFQAKLGSSERTRLGELAIQLGFASAWCDRCESPDPAVRRAAFARIAALSHCEAIRRLADGIPLRGLDDPDPQVRLEAARALALHEEPGAVALAFEAALRFAPLARIELAPLLRRHALLLSESAIPKALRHDHARDLLKVLRLLCSWECNLPIADLSPLARHANPEVRREALRLLALLPPTAENRRAILSALADEDVTVALAAVQTAGRLKLPAALPRLASCLRRGDRALARAAAAVLADMPLVGWQALEDHLPNPDPIASDAAHQALAAVHADLFASRHASPSEGPVQYIPLPSQAWTAEVCA
jgi:HEAT repeat protein